MRTSIAMLIVASGMLAGGPAWAKCFGKGEFRLTSEGPWPFYLTVDAGTKCVNRHFTSRRGAILQKLNAYELPSHGKLELQQGGRYSYVPDPSYRGRDAFLLEVCGITTSGSPGCSKLQFDVRVQ